MEGCSIVPEERIIIALNGIASAEITVQTLRSMIRRSDCEMIAALVNLKNLN